VGSWVGVTRVWCVWAWYGRKCGGEGEGGGGESSVSFWERGHSRLGTHSAERAIEDEARRAQMELSAEWRFK